MTERVRLGRILAAALLMDGSFYLVLTAVPLRAVELGASSLLLGLMPVLSAGIYVVSALFFGRLSDRLPRLALARIGAGLRFLAALGLGRTHSLAGLLAWLPAFGIANGLFWPGLQADLGEGLPRRALSRNLGAFNVSWSTGKMLGFVAGGLILSGAGFSPALRVAAAATLLTALLLPESGRTPAVPPADEGKLPKGHFREEEADPARRAAWRRVGWLANFVLFGVGATLNYQYPKLMVALGFGGRDFGVYLGIIYLFQTLSFALLARWGGWHYRRAPLLLCQGLALAAVMILGFLRSFPLILATAPWIGLGLGISYSSSLFYSLHGEPGKGRNTGIHEALIGTGTFLLPLLGGAAAQGSGSLLAPGLFCALALALTMAGEVLILSRAGRGRGAFRGGRHP